MSADYEMFYNRNILEEKLVKNKFSDGKKMNFNQKVITVDLEEYLKLFNVENDSGIFQQLEDAESLDLDEMNDSRFHYVDFVYKEKHFPVIYALYRSLVYYLTDMKNIPIKHISSRVLMELLRLKHFTYDINAIPRNLSDNFHDTIVFGADMAYNKDDEVDITEFKNYVEQMSENKVIELPRSPYSSGTMLRIFPEEDDVILFKDDRGPYPHTIYDRTKNVLLTSYSRVLFWDFIYPFISEYLKPNPEYDKVNTEEVITNTQMTSRYEVLPWNYISDIGRYTQRPYLFLDGRFAKKDEPTDTLIEHSDLYISLDNKDKYPILYSEYEGGYILKKEAEWIERYQDYIHENNKVYSEIEDEYFHEDDDNVRYSEYYGDYISEYNNEVVYSESSDTYLYRDDAIYCDYDDDWIPDDGYASCNEADDEEYCDSIGSYHSSGYDNIDNIEDSDINLGFELETHLKSDYELCDEADKILDDFNKILSIEADSSLTYGFEIVSGIFTPEFIYSDELKDLMEIISEINATKYSDAGLHVHISFPGYKDVNVRANLLRTIINTYDIFSGLYRRKFNRYATNATKKEINRFISRKAYLSRYTALNIVETEKGLEIRLFNTTDKYEDLIAALEFGMVLAEYGMKGDFSEPFIRFFKKEFPEIWFKFREQGYARYEAKIKQEFNWDDIETQYRQDFYNKYYSHRR